MKFLLLLFTINVFALTTISEQIELERRINLYGLNKSLRPIKFDNKVLYDQSIIEELENNIKNKYIPHLIEKISSCGKENCIEDNGKFLKLKLSTKDVCLPFTKCGFYECMENKYSCKNENVNYFTDLAEPTCNQYVSNIKKEKLFTQKGHDWIYSVMLCLQKGLIEECEVNNNCQKSTPKKTCDYITDFTLKFHPGCYLNSSIGICNLPLMDKINIWRTVSKFLTKRERFEAYKVILNCIRVGK